VAERISTANPDLIEVNISCPNVTAEFGRPFALDPASAAPIYDGRVRMPGPGCWPARFGGDRSCAAARYSLQERRACAQDAGGQHQRVGQPDPA